MVGNIEFRIFQYVKSWCLLDKHGCLAGRKWVFNDSRNTTIFGKIPENNYMFRSLIEWAIIRLKTRKITEKITQRNM
jgi:hypothetical protein